MKTTFIILFSLLTITVIGQKNLTEKAQPIVEEGKLLYRSEMASWYGTDLFLEKYKDRENVGGYFSYTENDISKCIFFSRSEPAQVIGTITFEDDTYNTSTATVDMSERKFTAMEKDLFLIRVSALTIMNTDTLFKRYENTNLNLIPLIRGKEKKVYVLTGPQQNGVVILGNDYLLTFDKNNKVKTKKQIHKNIIPIYYGEGVGNGKDVQGAIHTHLPETGDFITATDICTLMLYEKFAGWKTHNVVSKKYLSIWNCKTDELIVISTDTAKKINKEQGKTKK